MPFSRFAPYIVGTTGAATPPSALWPVEGFETSLQQRATAGAVASVNQRLRDFGLTASAELEAFWKLVRVRHDVDRGQTIIGAGDSVKRFTLLLGGVACFSSQQEDGGRHVYAFYYRGDILGLHNFVFPASTEPSEVQALASCSVGTIDRTELEQAIQRHPALGQALWRAAMMEVSIYRQRLVVSRRPALQRVAHLLCEQLARLGADDKSYPAHPNRRRRCSRTLGSAHQSRTSGAAPARRPI